MKIALPNKKLDMWQQINHDHYIKCLPQKIYAAINSYDWWDFRSNYLAWEDVLSCYESDSEIIK